MQRDMTRAAALTALLIVNACGGGGSPTGPGGGSGGGNNGGGSGGGSGNAAATITIGANGLVTPTAVTISPGQTVAFTNNSNRTRNISSDPHPEHTDCQGINSVNLVSPGQTKVTAALTAVRTCGFHDHDDPDNAGLKGAITVR